MNKQPLVSVIIPTYNSEETIEKCLQSIKNQTYKNVEIIIVDKFSKDRTIEIAKKYGAKIIQSYAEMSEARNIGFKNTSKHSKYVIFIDSDMELSPRVIEECVKLAESNEKIGGIIIPEISVGNNILAKIRAFERSFYAGTDIEAARFFRRDLVEKVGGYDEDIIFYEDHTLPQKIERLGYNVKARIGSIIIHHEENLTLFKHLRKKYYYGKTAPRYRVKFKNYSKKQMSLLYRFMIFFSNKYFYSKPLLALGVIFLKLVEYMVSGLGYVIGRIKNYKKLYLVGNL